MCWLRRRSRIHHQRYRLQLACFVAPSYNGFFFVTLKPWDETQVSRGAVSGDQATNQPGISRFRKASAFSFHAGHSRVGTSGGFTFALEDRAGRDVQFLATNLQTFLGSSTKGLRLPA